MSKNKKNKNKTLVFKRKKIEYPEENPIKELIELYEEQDIDDQHQGLDSVSDSEQDLSLRTLINKDRKKRKKRFIIFSLIVLLLLAGSALAGFLYFSSNKTFEKQSLELTIEGPEKIKIGEQFDFIINYQNLGEVSLLDSRLHVQYPHGLLIEKLEPEPVNHAWQLGELEIGDNGQITISGSIIDEIEEEQKIIVKLTFQPSNFNSEFTKEATFSLITQAPELEFITNYPSNITPGQKINLKTKIKNEAKLDFYNAKLQITYPDKFTFQSANPTTYEDDNQWIIADLNQSSQSKEILVEGFFDADMNILSDNDRTKTFLLELLLLGNEEQYFKVHEEELSIKIIDQAINTYTIVNGTTENKNIELGQDLDFTIISKNTGEQDYNNLILTTTINSQPVDLLNWNKIEDDYYGKIEKTETGKQITWDKTQIPELATLATGQEFSLDFSLPLNTFADLDSINSLGKASLDVFSSLDLSEHLGVKTEPVTSSHVILTINSDLDLGTKALYYFEDGTPIGSGPLPFEVGKKTTIKVFWDLSNDIHEIENITVNASLPEYAEWPDESYVSTGEINYNSNTNKITWEINRLPETVKEAHANFAIVITPELEDAGKIIKLTGNTTLSAKDSVSEDTIIKTKNILTSALELDQHAETDGIVQQ
ncbi:hypothetical protein HN858_03690 [Candidatus Falkowbacteria bacterium]|jgi:hypothetical protein|nr:hypothetical protein [Candidatus Falkowbacteria bacterium]MBT5503701.1 hypothetical protein [Candidatus Falkowbacteria bacterium]MBT7348753.1 hypothetical protein [Candidatus Falkowbacteria bacterium]MBT7500543.1 hypothetical protein [Candidatus Falkowbacteria bacterium]